jgi:hypothetical protein
MSRRLCLLLGIFALSVHALAEVTVESNAIDNAAIFGIEFSGSNRAFYGKEVEVQSVSLQEYVTASFRVFELNVVTQGPALLRIYHSRPLQVGELQEALGSGASSAGVPGGGSIIRTPLPPNVQAMADRASGASEAATSTTVVKEYPIATHAHTIEFRVATRATLFQLHDELKRHWLQEPALFRDGQIVDSAEAGAEEQARRLGGTLFRVGD